MLDHECTADVHGVCPDCGLRSHPAPARIVIEPYPLVGWRFEIQAEDGTVLDYSLSKGRPAAWAMARLSWRRLMKEARRG